MTLADYTQDKAHIPPEELAMQAVRLAEVLLAHADEQITPEERAQSRMMEGMMDDEAGKVLTMLMADQAFRTSDEARVADQIEHLLKKYGIPEYFTAWERAALAVGMKVAKFTPQLVVPFIVAYLRRQTSRVILAGEERPFRNYLAKRRRYGTRLNINHLGEAILGEAEAEKRFNAYLDLLARPDVEYISVKISSIFSQINHIAYDWTLDKLKGRLRQLYRQAQAHHFVGKDGTEHAKFVNLDMEEYGDLHLTMDAFMQVLDEPEFLHYRAGIVLQAYLPDSTPAQHQLTEWALERVKRGGAPIKLRLVKGANLAMEQVTANLHGWEQAPYTSKADVDANFKRMVTFGCDPERIKAVHLGIASHNLFDMAYALLLRERHELHAYMEFEMLEGMANHQARALQERADGLLLYAPVVKQQDFHSAIAYLVRRLDENTAPENFLHDLFGMKVDSPEWEKQKDLFLDAYQKMNSVYAHPRRTQDRNAEHPEFDVNAPFRNVPDTDFSLPQNQRWAKHIRDRWHNIELPPIPLQIGGQIIAHNFTGEGVDPARPSEIAYRYAQATPEEIDKALNVAVEAGAKWAQKPIQARKATLVKCAEVLAQRRGDFLGAMMLDGGKRIAEADPEISEAIDFANYYAHSLDMAESELNDLTPEPLGVVLITPPWNFPMAIPTGGVLSALMAGNAVIFKPAPEAMLVGWQIVNALWDAGVPREVLQFVPTTDDEVGRGLVTDDRVNAVILTGAYATAKLFLGWKPDLKLFAETSGKNSMIISRMADHDLAIKDLVKSAFGHSGQKCSASSLAILEREVYENEAFRRQLVDAAQSLEVGQAWDMENFITPIIREPSPDLKRALTTLEEGESWLLKPRMVNEQENLWTPGIKIGVRRGSFYHKTECFGPVLGIMCADDLDDAIDIANEVDYGLTSGLHSLDEREIAIWRERIEAGNAYINRGTTGAIVQRQPFGGWKQSVFGYAKAGGPNYVPSLMTWRDTETLDDQARIAKATASYQDAWRNHFSVEHDPSARLGETNHFRYRPIKRMLLRVNEGDNMNDVALIAIAARTVGVLLMVSADADVKLPDVKQWGAVHVVESEESFLKAIHDTRFRFHQRVRVLSESSEALRIACNDAHVPLIEVPVVANGRMALRHFLHEQAVSQTIHRYGNIIR
jgi:RHH-type proline utilization regulon transcriptional repressor/proline dehydrogenase/delta 1-pyrroline-5-carboxylate dehydrogenase